jgi:hypothetical protein
MATLKTKKLSAKELAVLQAKIDAGTPLTEGEQASYDAASGSSEEQSAPDFASSIEKLADVIIAKSHGHVAGGKPHVPLSAEEVKKLPKKSQDEVADEYFSHANKDGDFPWPGIHVTSDNQVFLGNVPGENARDNHIASSAVNGSPTLSFKSYPKP